MKIHYFQRYHAKENVATANSMLLLSRLYAYSTDKFFRFLQAEIFENSFEAEIVFELQVKSSSSVPDAIISQQSFKIVVETKGKDKFNVDQLSHHLKSFTDEKHKVIMTLAPQVWSDDEKSKFENILNEMNRIAVKEGKTPIFHINMTFEKLVRAVQAVLDEHDIDMQDIVDDYLDYCCNDHLISSIDKWKYLRVHLAGKTFEFNKANNLYYNGISRGFRPHKYLGLYKEKSVKAIGEIEAIITAVVVEGKYEYKVEMGDLTKERKKKIQEAIEDGKNYGYILTGERYFFVKKFYDTDFKKSTLYAPRGSRVFDLTDFMKLSENSDTQSVADALDGESWH